jgi:hypothetical protein
MRFHGCHHYRSIATRLILMRRHCCHHRQSNANRLLIRTTAQGRRAMEIPGITSLCHLIIILIYHFGFDFEYQVMVVLSDTITGKDGVCQIGGV